MAQNGGTRHVPIHRGPAGHSLLACVRLNRRSSPLRPDSVSKSRVRSTRIAEEAAKKGSSALPRASKTTPRRGILKKSKAASVGKPAAAKATSDGRTRPRTRGAAKEDARVELAPLVKNLDEGGAFDENAAAKNAKRRRKH
jgi:hypothetical protein